MNEKLEAINCLIKRYETVCKTLFIVTCSCFAIFIFQVDISIGSSTNASFKNGDGIKFMSNFITIFISLIDNRFTCYGKILAMCFTLICIAIPLLYLNVIRYFGLLKYYASYYVHDNCKVNISLVRNPFKLYRVFIFMNLIALALILTLPTAVTPGTLDIDLIKLYINMLSASGFMLILITSIFPMDDCKVFVEFFKCSTEQNKKEIFIKIAVFIITLTIFVYLSYLVNN